MESWYDTGITLWMLISCWEHKSGWVFFITIWLCSKVILKLNISPVSHYIFLNQTHVLKTQLMSLWPICCAYDHHNSTSTTVVLQTTHQVKVTKLKTLTQKNDLQYNQIHTWSTGSWIFGRADFVLVWVLNRSEYDSTSIIMWQNVPAHFKVSMLKQAINVNDKVHICDRYPVVLFSLPLSYI